MAVPLSWPSKYNFYPIGSHAALCLTRDIAPEQDASLLLLPCGDPRNVLYTVFCETSSVRQTLDFTCCDFDPGVLARNVLLLAMIMDNVPTNIVWSTYLDMYLDRGTLAAFITQCRKLVEQSQTTEAWRASPYRSILTMGSDLTLSEVHRHWSLYLEAAVATGDRAQTIRQLMNNGRKQVLEEHYETADGSTVFSTGRSAGPLFLRAVPSYTKNLHRYWKTGTTSLTASLDELCVNPTFLYSKADESFAVHHGTDPLAPFHLAHVFGNAHDTPTAHLLTVSAQQEFRDWCDAFRSRASHEVRKLCVRFILGDVLAVSRALQVHNERTRHEDAIPVAQWTSQTLQLSPHEYEHSRAPTRFDVIDTSNICDYVGLVNVLLSSVPLLVDSSAASGVLYTESFIARDDASDPKQQLEAMLVTNLATHSLIFGVAPVGALSGFTTQCDTHELLLRRERDRLSGCKATQQHHQMITWRRPWTADCHAVKSVCSAPLIELSPANLSSLLLRIYDHLFGAENPFKMAGEGGTSTLTSNAISSSYTRETFVGFLHFLRPRICLTDAQWLDTMKLFLDQQRSAAMARNVFDGLSHREFNTLLYRYGVCTISALLEITRPRTGRISKWTTIPPLVRIYLTVPGDKLQVLQRLSSKLSNPPLHCVVQYPRFEHIFQSVHAVPGHTVDLGTPSEPSVAVQAEACGGGLGTTGSPLVLSFVVPTCTLTDVVDPETVFVRLSIRTNPATVTVFGPVLGPDLSIFSACLEDAKHVQVVPADRICSPRPLGSPIPVIPMGPAAIGRLCPVHLELGDRDTAATLTARLLVEDPQARTLFSGARAMPTITQASTCTMRVALGAHAQNVIFPVPVVGGESKGRLARSSSYIEVVVPVAVPAPGNSDAIRLDPFPVVRTGSDALVPWNLHHINLDQQPMIDAENPALQSWLDTHIGSHFSEREGMMKRRQRTPDTLTLLKDTIHYIIAKAAGLQNCALNRVFALRDDATNESDTILFVRGLRYDLGSHTVVCDAFVLPLFPDLMPTLCPWFTRLVNSDITNTRTFEGESRAWKQLLPALVERCRHSWRHGPNCEYVAQGRIPLSVEVNGGDPLCSCGRGKDVEGMREVEVWRDFAPFVTRIALSPLCAVSYMEQVLPQMAARAWRQTDTGTVVPLDLSSNSVRPIVGPPPAPLKLARQCKRCEKSGQDVKKCAGCNAAMYCSKACQRADWPSHKQACEPRRK